MKNKKICRFLAVTLMIIIMATAFANITTYSVTSCDMEMLTAKTEVTRGTEFTVDINISNIVSDRGVIAVSAVFDYDEDDLELVSAEGQNGWESLTQDVNYNAENGKIAVTRETVCKDDETIFTLTFKVKDDAKDATTVYFKDIEVADGDKLYTISEIKKDYTIIDVQVQEDEITSEKYTVEENYISKITPSTTFAEFKNNIAKSNEDMVLSLVDKDGNEVSDNEKVATGMVLKSKGNSDLSYTIVVTGDIDGTGEIDSNDLAKIKLHLIDKIELTGSEFKAADLLEDSVLDANDLARVKLVLINLMTIE